MKKIFVSSAIATIHEDSYEEGEGKYSNEFVMDIKGKTFSSYKDFIKSLCDEFYYENGSSTYEDFLEIDDQNNEVLFYTDFTLNSENVMPSENEFESWKKGNLTLYSARCYFDLKLVSDISSLEELKNL